MIFVNDASTDDTEDIIKLFIKKNPLFKLINFRKNKGVSCAIMAGIKAMNTNWYARFDPDDLIVEEYFNQIPKYTNDNNSLIRFKFKRIDDDDNIYHPYFAWHLYFKTSWGFSCLINLKYADISNVHMTRFADDLILFSTIYRKNTKKHIFINKYLYLYRNRREKLH